MLAGWRSLGGTASTMMTLSCVWTIPQSRATEMAVSMLSPIKGFQKCRRMARLLLTALKHQLLVCNMTFHRKKKDAFFLPVTIKVRILACRNWYKTPAVSSFILFCMMIKPRNSMLVSITSLEPQRNRTAHQRKTNHRLLPINPCKLVHRRCGYTRQAATHR